MTQPGELSPADERELVRELAHTVLEQAAPDELAVFDRTAEEYFRAPGKVLSSQRREDAVDFGIDLALLTPFALAVVTPVVQLLAKMVADAVKSEGQPVVTAIVRRLLRSRPTEPEGVTRDTRLTLTPDQVRRLRDVAFDRGLAVGLPEGEAAMLADAIAGGVVAGT